MRSPVDAPGPAHGGALGTSTRVVAAMAVGIGRAALDASVAFAREHDRLGNPRSRVTPLLESRLATTRNLAASDLIRDRVAESTDGSADRFSNPYGSLLAVHATGSGRDEGQMPPLFLVVNRNAFAVLSTWPSVAVRV